MLRQPASRLDAPRDPRRTKIGAFLRRTNLDELPQLWNVLKGEMSLVGPRPERPYFVEQFSQEIPKYPDRHLVKSGLTGWAQIHGLRGDTSIARRTQYDLYYVQNWSLWLDLRILAITFWQGIRGRLAGY
jgi:putative colanic acid biosynthesis UDP-glucose lipid carrier transferase